MGTVQPSYIPLSRRIPAPKAPEASDLARAWKVIVVRIFGINAALDGMTANVDIGSAKMEEALPLRYESANGLDLDP